MEILSMAIACSIWGSSINFCSTAKVECPIPQTAIVRVETPKKVTSNKLTRKNCVLYARSKTTVDIPYGLFTKRSKNKAVNTETPKVGIPVVTNEGKVGHLAIVKEIQQDKILIEEANYVAGKITTRWLSKQDNRIVGYIE